MKSLAESGAPTLQEPGTTSIGCALKFISNCVLAPSGCKYSHDDVIHIDQANNYLSCSIHVITQSYAFNEAKKVGYNEANLQLDEATQLFILQFCIMQQPCIG